MAVTRPGAGTVERMFDALAAADWDSFGALLASDVERIGPFGERLEGRDPYVELMSGGATSGGATSDTAAPERRTTWDVHCVAYASDARSAFARITAHVPQGDRELTIEQTLAYTLGEDGRIARIEVFWRDPRS
jgi:ketosteroid isomerase-like protein